MDIESHFAGDSDSEGGSDDGSWFNSDSISDSEFEGPLDSEEERESLKTPNTFKLSVVG
jgi:hypothetical protein